MKQSVTIGILAGIGLALFVCLAKSQNKYYVRSATLEPKEVHLVSGTVSGIVQKIHFRVGDEVQEGDVLLDVKLDAPEEIDPNAPFEIADDIAVIKAPISGTILSVDAKPGQRITTTQRDPIFSIADLSTLYAIIGIPPSDVHAFEPGMTVSFTQDRHGGTILAKNQIERIEPEPVWMRSLSKASIQAARKDAHRTYVEIDNSHRRFYPKSEWWAHVHLQ